MEHVPPQVWVMMLRNGCEVCHGTTWLDVVAGEIRCGGHWSDAKTPCGWRSRADADEHGEAARQVFDTLLIASDQPVASCSACDFATATHGDDGMGMLECLADGHRIDDDIDPELAICPGCPMAGKCISWPQRDATTCDACHNPGPFVNGLCSECQADWPDACTVFLTNLGRMCAGRCDHDGDHS